MRRSATVLSVAVMLGTAGCGMDMGAEGSPEAPTGLTATLLSGGAHLMWTDNADNEEGFLIMRKEVGGTLSNIAMPTFNANAYHDATTVAGKTYLFHIMAMNEKGESAPSNEVTIAIP